MGGMMEVATGAVTGLFGGGDDAADAAKKGSQIQANAQREALEYLKEREELPQQFREGALTQLGGLFGLQGGDANALANLRNTGIYKSALGDIGAQEEAILRNQAATGALRTSATEQMLANNQQQREFAAMQAAMGGLSGLAQLPSNAQQIAAQTAGIGQTLGQGYIGAAQSKQAGMQAGMENMMGLGQLGLAAFTAFCDPRLKSNAVKIGEIDGYNIYRWTWNDAAEALGLHGEAIGPMADEVQKREPERVTMRNGYMYVNARKGVLYG